MLDLPDGALPLYLRVTRANRTYATAEGARARMRESSLRPSTYGPPRRLRRDVRIEVTHDGPWPVYTVSPRTPGRVVGGLVYVHGGGWVNQISPFHWRLVADVAAGAGIAVTVPIYPLVPHGTAGPTRDTIVRLVRSSTAVHGPTCLAGDSAGGQIALSAALALRESGIRVPRTTLISPALDLTWSNPRIPEVQPSDPWLGTAGGTVLAEAWRGNLPLTDPAVSPLFGDLTGLGPLTVFTGTRDILNPDAHLLVAKARSAGVDVTLHEEPGQLHVYPLVPSRVGRRAARALVEEVAESVRTGAPVNDARDDAAPTVES